MGKLILVMGGKKCETPESNGRKQVSNDPSSLCVCWEGRMRKEGKEMEKERKK